MKKEILLSDISPNLRDFLLKTLSRDPSFVHSEIHNPDRGYLKFFYPFNELNRKALSQLILREDFDGVEMGKDGYWFIILFTY